MTPKQRVLETLEGRIPDRVPWGEFAVGSRCDNVMVMIDEHHRLAAY